MLKLRLVFSGRETKGASSITMHSRSACYVHPNYCWHMGFRLRCFPQSSVSCAGLFFQEVEPQHAPLRLWCRLPGCRSRFSTLPHMRQAFVVRSFAARQITTGFQLSHGERSPQ
jgi:hypothetical protein